MTGTKTPVPGYFVAASVAVGDLLDEHYDGTFSERDNDVVRTALEAAAPLIAAAERERIRQLAIEHNAHYDCDPDYGMPFADLIGDSHG
jgi:hypothetical protein